MSSSHRDGRSDRRPHDEPIARRAMHHERRPVGLDRQIARDFPDLTTTFARVARSRPIVSGARCWYPRLEALLRSELSARLLVLLAVGQPLGPHRVRALRDVRARRGAPSPAPARVSLHAEARQLAENGRDRDRGHGRPSASTAVSRRRSSHQEGYSPSTALARSSAVRICPSARSLRLARPHDRSEPLRRGTRCARTARAARCSPGGNVGGGEDDATCRAAAGIRSP